MKTYDILTPANASDVQAWQAKAVNEPEVARFLSSSDCIHYEELGSNNWECTFLMDKRRLGMVYLKPDRTPSHTISFGCHVLPGSHQKYVAGLLLLAAFDVAKKRLSGKWLEWNVHGTNKACLEVSRNLMDTRNAVTWGMRRKAYWDSGIGELVDSYHFRMPL